MSYTDNERGISLVEVLISIVLGTIVLLGVTQSFITSKQIYHLTKSRATLQENARFAIEFLKQDIRLAGYNIGNASLDDGCPSDDDYILLPNKIQGLEWVPTSKKWHSGACKYDDDDFISKTDDIVDTSDIITIRRAEVKRIKCRDDCVQGDDGDVINLTDSPSKLSLKCGNFAVIAENYNKATVFQVIYIKDKVIKISEDEDEDEDEDEYGCDGSKQPSLAEYNKENVYIHKYRNISYYIRKSKNEPILYRKINKANAESLVNGIEAMRIWYEKDNQYRTAKDIDGGWNEVKKVRIRLLLRSKEVGILKSKEILGKFADFPGITSETLEDKRLRRVFTTTIAIRIK